MVPRRRELQLGIFEHEMQLLPTTVQLTLVLRLATLFLLFIVVIFMGCLMRGIWNLQAETAAAFRSLQAIHALADAAIQQSAKTKDFVFKAGQLWKDIKGT